MLSNLKKRKHKHKHKLNSFTLKKRKKELAEDFDFGHKKVVHFWIFQNRN